MDEYNVIPWSPSPPTRPGLYLVEDHEGRVIVVSVYPEKGNLLVRWGPSVVSLGYASNIAVRWSARISWAEIFV